MRRVIVLLLSALLLCGCLSAASAGAKNEGTAMLLSGLLLPGSGQMYAGEGVRGGVILVGEVALLSAASSDDGSSAASLGALGLYVWQVFDAGKCAKKYNEKNGYAGAGLTSEHKPLPDRWTSVQLDPLNKGAKVSYTVKF